jgi:sugar lactone lactonase YvrE
VVLERILSVDREEDVGLRLNDGACDGAGRFWVSEVDSKGLGDKIFSHEGWRSRRRNEPESRVGLGSGEGREGRGRLWMYDVQKGLRVMEMGVLCGNGIAWSLHWGSSELIISFVLVLACSGLRLS